MCVFCGWKRLGLNWYYDFRLGIGIRRQQTFLILCTRSFHTVEAVGILF